MFCRLACIVICISMCSCISAGVGLVQSVASIGKKDPSDNIKDIPIPEDIRIAPVQGAPVIAAKVPTFCPDGTSKLEKRHYLPEDLPAIHKGWVKELTVVQIRDRSYDTLTRDIATELSDIILYACTRPQSQDRQSWVASGLQHFANEYFVPQKALSYILTVLAEKIDEQGRTSSVFADYEKELQQSCRNISVPRKSSPMDKRLHALLRKGINCYDDWRPNERDIDRENLLVSQIHLVGWVSYRFRRNHVKEPTGLDRGIYAILDVPKVSARKYFAELNKLGIKGAHKVESVIRFYAMKRNIADWERGHRDALGEKVFSNLIEVAKKAGKEWTESNKKFADKYKDLLAVEHALELQDKYMLQGCQKKTSEYVFSMLRQRKAKTEAQLKKVLSTPFMAQLAGASESCEYKVGSKSVAYVLSRLSESVSAIRGPRTAMQPALYKAVVYHKDMQKKLPLDARRYKYRYGWLSEIDTSELGHTYFNMYKTEESGQVATVKKRKEGYQVTFKRESSVTTTTTGCRQTNRVERIDSNGNVIYAVRCSGSKRKRVYRQAKPFLVPNRFAAAIRPGRFITFRRGIKTPGVVTQVFRTPKQRKKIAYLGIKLR